MPIIYTHTILYILTWALYFNKLNQHVYVYNNRSVNIDNISVRHFVMPLLCLLVALNGMLVVVL